MSPAGARPGGACPTRRRKHTRPVRADEVAALIAEAGEIRRTDITAAFGLAPGAAAHHLRTLLAAGRIVAIGEASRRRYRLADVVDRAESAPTPEAAHFGGRNGANAPDGPHTGTRRASGSGPSGVDGRALQPADLANTSRWTVGPLLARLDRGGRVLALLHRGGPATTAELHHQLRWHGVADEHLELQLAILRRRGLIDHHLEPEHTDVWTIARRTA